MKTSLLLIFLTLQLALFAEKRPTVIKLPSFDTWSSNTIEIEKIELGKQATVFYIKAYAAPNNWISMDRTAHIKASGSNEKLIITSSEGFPLDEKFYMPMSGEVSFKLFFPPLPAGITKIDFIEGDCENCFKIWGIHLTPEQVKKDRIPASVIKAASEKDDSKPLSSNGWAQGTAKFKGRFWGYNPSLMKTFEIFVSNPVTGISDEYIVNINENGNFEQDIALVSKLQSVSVKLFQFRESIYLSPEKETVVDINLREYSRRQSRLRKDTPQDTCLLYCTGTNAVINNRKFNPAVRQIIDQASLQDDIYGMTAEQYKEYYLGKYKNAEAALRISGLDPKIFELALLDIKMGISHQLMFADHNLEWAYRNKHNLGLDVALPDSIVPVFDIGYYSFMRDLALNDSVMLYSPYYEGFVNSCNFIHHRLRKENTFVQLFSAVDFFNQLIADEAIAPEDITLVKELMDGFSEDIDPESEKAKDLIAKYTDLAAKYEKYIDAIAEKHFFIRELSLSDSIVSRILGTDHGLLLDLMKTQAICKKMEEYSPLDKARFDMLAQMSDPFYLDYITRKNNELIAKIESKKGAVGYTIHQVPESPEEEIFSEILKPFAGKAIFVDFWATWCGPCRQAMKDFAPLKKEYEGKDIAFIYLTDQTSPETAWKNAIPDIPGEHYRLTNEQFKHLKHKFGVNGVPSYLIIDKAGQQSYFTVGFPGVPKMKDELNKALNK